MTDIERPNVVRAGHVALTVPDLDAVRRFYVDLLGFDVVHETDDALYLRGYEEREWSLKLERAEESGLKHIAYKVWDEADLDRVIELAESQGLPFRTAEDVERPRMVRVQDPQGFPIVFYREAGRHQPRLQDYHEHRGPGVLRLDHFNYLTPDVAESLKFYRDALGFRLTEYTEDDEGNWWAAWLHRKGNVHDMALTNGTGPRLHHFAYWLSEPSSVLNAADILGGADWIGSIERGPGRHGISNAMFLYLRDPAGHRIELYTADYLTVDPEHEPIRWDLNDPRRQTLWGTPTPKSWFLEGSAVEAFDGGWVEQREPSLKGLPQNVR